MPLLGTERGAISGDKLLITDVNPDRPITNADSHVAAFNENQKKISHMFSYWLVSAEHFDESETV